jgi:hypothetical protein
MNHRTIDLKLQQQLQLLKGDIDGEIFFKLSDRLMYATDASAYRELPVAVAYPKNKEDIKKLIRFARDYQTSLIPRTAGTSLAGQVVGHGIVVDVSKYMTRILEINKDGKWVSGSRRAAMRSKISWSICRSGARVLPADPAAPSIPATRVRNPAAR